MAEIENQTLRVLRDIRTAIKSLEGRFDGLEGKVDQGFADVRSRMNSLRQAINGGESVLGRYAASEVEERLEALERRVSKLEKAT
jgi:polyhydroxyalkanoate synthesis regulator phasin